MASDKEYLDFIMEQFGSAPGVSYRAMMGEYVLYYNGKVFGGIFDNQLLVKDVPGSESLLPEAERVIPYPGARPMLEVDNVDDRDFLAALVRKMYGDLPEPKPKKNTKIPKQ